MELVCSLVDRFSELREEFQERITLGEGNVDRLVAQAQRELRELTSETAWRNSWTGEGYTPDFERLMHRLGRLVDQGHADAVVKLGREFIERAMGQVEEADDEGETAMAAADCMPVIFDGVSKSSLSGVEKILFAIDTCLADSFDVVGEAVDTILDVEWPKSDWSAVADELGKRLKKMAKTVDREYSYKYARDRLSGWLLGALENAGRDDELLVVYEAEARETGSYKRLVEYLIGERKYEEAERWAQEGIEKTCEERPGIASSLASVLCDLARQRRQWDVVAADAAWRFFEHPSASTFKELVDRARKAKCVKAVRAAALAFLETGKAPVEPVVVAKGKEKGKRKLRVDSDWPLPVPDHLVAMICKERSFHVSRGPHFDVLLDMAIDAKDPTEVLRWYDKMCSGDGRPVGVWGGSTADRVAARGFRGASGTGVGDLPPGAGIAASARSDQVLRVGSQVSESDGADHGIARAGQGVGDAGGRDSGKVSSTSAVHGDSRQARETYDRCYAEGTPGEAWLMRRWASAGEADRG